MTDDARFRPPGEPQQYGDATRPVYSQSSGPVPPGAGTPPSSYTPGSGSPGTAPSYSPSYGGNGGGGGDDQGGGFPPSYSSGGEGSGGGMFPWLAVIIGVVVVAAAAFAIWFFVLRHSGGPDESITDPPPEESPSGESPSAPVDTVPDGQETESESGSASDDPDDEQSTESESEAPSDGGAESPSDGSSTDGIQLEIGETHEMSDGVTITLEEVDADYSCPAALGQDLAVATFTMEVPADASPTDAPIGGLTLSTSEGPIDMFAGIGCLEQDESMSPVVMPGTEETGLVIIPSPTSGAYDLEYTPLLSGLTGGSSETLSWSIEP